MWANFALDQMMTIILGTALVLGIMWLVGYGVMKLKRPKSATPTTYTRGGNYRKGRSVSRTDSRR